MKTCHACHETKPVSEFYHRGDKAGYRPNCKECFKIRNNTNKGRARIAAVKEKDAIEKNPHGFLAAGIIEKAIKDYKEDDSMRGEVLAFFCSGWFEELAGFAGCDPEYLRKHISNLK